MAQVFRAPKAGNVRKLIWATRTVTTGGTMDVRLETVSLTTGDPTGTLLGTNSNGSQVVADSDDNTNFATQMTADCTVTKGQLLALVVVAPSGVSVQVAQWLTVNFNPSDQRFPYSDYYTSSWAKTAGWMAAGLEYDDGSVCYGIDQPFPIKTLTALTTFSNSSTPDERGWYFRRPVSDALVGIWFQGARGADMDVVVYDSDSNVLLTESFDKDVTQGTGFHFLSFTSQVTITANSWYRVVLKPTTASSISIATFDVATAAHMDAFQGGQDMHYTSRTDAGAWTNVTTTRLFGGLAFERSTAAAGGVRQVNVNGGADQ